MEEYKAMSATVELEETDFLKQLHERGVAPKHIKEALASVLYYSDTIMGKEACEMLGVARRVFEDEILPKFGFTTYGNTPEDAAIELDAANV